MNWEIYGASRFAPVVIIGPSSLIHFDIGQELKFIDPPGVTEAHALAFDACHMEALRDLLTAKIAAKHLPWFQARFASMSNATQAIIDTLTGCGMIRHIEADIDPAVAAGLLGDDIPMLATEPVAVKGYAITARGEEVLNDYVAALIRKDTPA